MGLFRRKIKQKVGDKEVAIDEKLVASFKEAFKPKPKRSRYIVEGVSANRELRRIAEEAKARANR